MLVRTAKPRDQIRRVTRCSACREPGHNINNCQQRYRLPDVSVYATARGTNMMDAA